MKKKKKIPSTNSNMISGKKYLVANEILDKKRLKKEEKSMSTAGIAKALTKSQKNMYKSYLLNVKPQKKC